MSILSEVLSIFVRGSTFGTRHTEALENIAKATNLFDVADDLGQVLGHCVKRGAGIIRRARAVERVRSERSINDVPVPVEAMVDSPPAHPPGLRSTIKGGDSNG